MVAGPRTLWFTPMVGVEVQAGDIARLLEGGFVSSGIQLNTIK